MTALRLVRLLTDLTATHGADTRVSDLPLGVLEAERKRSEANGAGVGVPPSAPVGAARVTAATAPHPTRRTGGDAA